MLSDPPEFNNLAKFHAVDQIAEALDVSPRTISRLIKSGDLVAYRFGRAVRIAEADLQVFLATRRGDEP